MNSKYVFVTPIWAKIAFFACGGHLGFSQLTVSKKYWKQLFSVFIETLGREKLQFYKFI